MCQIDVWPSLRSPNDHPFGDGGRSIRGSKQALIERPAWPPNFRLSFGSQTPAGHPASVRWTTKLALYLHFWREIPPQFGMPFTRDKLARLR